MMIMVKICEKLACEHYKDSRNWNMVDWTDSFKLPFFFGRHFCQQINVPKSFIWRKRRHGVIAKRGSKCQSDSITRAAF